MNKLVIKTVYITLLAILTISIAVLSAFCVFKPKVIAKMFDDLDNYQASQYFYQRQYEKTQDIEDLLVLIDNAYEKQETKELIQYLEDFLEHKDYKAYCQTKDSTLKPGEMTTEVYYQMWYDELVDFLESAG